MCRLRLGQIFVIRMHADRCEQVGVSFGQCKHFGKILEVDAHAERMTYVVIAHSTQQFVEVARKIGKIQMTMRVNKHG